MVRSFVWVGLLALATGAGQLLAQSPGTNKPGEPEVYAPGETRSESSFDLFADRDFARAGLRMTDLFTGITQNDGNWSTPTQRWNNFNPSPLFQPDWFDIFFYVAAGPGERDRAIAQGATSLANANNKGYTVNSSLSQFTAEIHPGDGTLGPHHSGVLDSGAGDCRDFRTLASGEPELAVSDCEDTHGSLGFLAARNVTQEGYEAYADSVMATEFSFDPWKVPAGLKAGNLGAFQAYGFFSDYSQEALFGSASHPAYNNVVPGGEGAATRSGWPLGMLVQMDAFHTPALDLTNVAWFQFTVVNNSGEVYGVDLDYDSIYMGLQPGWLTFNQGTSLYRDPTTNAVRGATLCQGFVDASSQGSEPGCGAGGDPQHPASQWGSIDGVGAGFNYGAAALVVMKSPIGDVRNKLFTDPTSPFMGLGDPDSWDDTITFNHGHMCGFHGCSAVLWNAPASTGANADYEQRQYGMVASITNDVLGDRAIDDVATHTRWDTWRWEEWPDATQMDFNRWTPGGWDWNDDGVDDELAWDDCTDNSGGQFDMFIGVTKNCAVTWSDTLPGGFGNVYSNRAAIMGVGPISMAANDTVQWVIAVVMANDREGLERQLSKAVEHYMLFYLAPAPATAPNIVSVDVQRGGAAAGEDAVGQPEASITLYWDDASDDYEDPFVAKTLADLLAAEDTTPVGILRNLNPVLVDTLNFLVENNVENVHLFKSCDSGGGFTDDGNCFDDPATGDGSIFTGAGWLPYETFQPDADGNFVNSFTDDAVFGGRSFLYALLAESRGLNLPVQVGDDAVFDAVSGEWLCVENCRGSTVDIPKILPIVPTSTSLGNVVDVYVPVAAQAGGQTAAVTLMTESPDFVPFDRMNVQPTQSEVSDGDYLLAFGDEVVVTETRVDGALTNTSVVIDGGDALTTDGVVSLADAPFTETTVGNTVTTEYTFSGLTSVLVGPGDVPLVVSDRLAGDETVPGSFFGLPNYPHFIYSADNSVAGSFESQGYTDADDEVIQPLVEPSVTWRDNLSSVTMQGRYRINWLAPAFGDESPFRLNFANPTDTKADIVASLENRESVTSSTDPEIASFIGLPPSKLLAVDLPFTVENITAGENNATPVTVVITDDGKQTSLLLGSGLDTMIVSQGLEDQWLPGDELLLIEGSSPDFIVSASPGILACDASVWLRVPCNPVDLQSRGASGYIENGADQTLSVSYFQEITAETEYEFNLASAVSGDDIMAANDLDRIRASLDSVKVVPNPFIMFSQYSTSGGTDRIIFTHVPPKGVLRIYTVSGQFVQQVRWEPENLNSNGDLFFNLRTREGNEMAAGLYLYVLTAKDEAGNEIGTAKGKFVVIK